MFIDGSYLFIIFCRTFFFLLPGHQSIVRAKRMAEFLDDPHTLNNLMAALSSPSVSNAGRNMAVMSQSTVSSSHGGGGTTQNKNMSLSAAAHKQAMDGQVKLQDAFSRPASLRANEALPSLAILHVLDQPRLHVEQYLMDVDPLSPGARAGECGMVAELVRPLPKALQAAQLQRRAPEEDDEIDKMSDRRSPLEAAGTPSTRRPQPPTSPNCPTAQRSGVVSQVAHSANFLSPKRDQLDAIGVVRMPPVGHYRPKHVLTEASPRSGYIEPLSRVRRTSPKRAAHGAEQQTHASLPHETNTNNGSATAKSGAYSSAASPVSSPSGSARFRARERVQASPPRVPHPFPVFQSKEPRIAPLPKTDGADEWYWPRCDRSLQGMGGAATGWDIAKPSPRRPQQTLSAAPDAFYNVQQPLGAASLHRTLDVSVLTSRDHYPVEQKFYYQKDIDLDANNVQRALDVTRLRTVKQVPDLEKHSPRKPLFNPTVAIGDISSNPTDPSCRRVQGPLPFEKLTAHQVHTFPYVPVEYDVAYAQGERRAPAATISASAPGHGAVHRPSFTEVSTPPSLQLVRPNIVQNVRIDLPSPRKEATSPIHDLQYNTTRDPSSPRIVGDPMISSSITREKRERAMMVGQHGGTGAVYTYELDSMARNTVDFARQVPRDERSSGRLAPSWGYQVRHPRAPGPGTYSVQ